MLTDELKEYIRQASASGATAEDIKQKLLEAGWPETDIREAIQEFNILTQQPLSSSRKTIFTKNFAYIILVGAILALGGATFYLWQERLDLSNTNAQKVRDFYARLAESQISFTDAGEIIFPDEQKLIDQKAEYIQAKKSFIDVDLRAMKLTLYDGGAAIKTIDVLTKGKERGWWETPTGNYKVLGKSTNSFSSIGNVWMPYSIQFYGNYFIHGWPYYENGNPVPQTYSGGCIRLSTEDAKAVFDFAKTGMPVLVLENYTEYNFGTLTLKTTDGAPPIVSAKSFLISDLSSGETLLEKRAEERLPIASITKLMTGVVAHEIIYLGRPIKITQQMLASLNQVFSPAVGEYYTGFDLLYPLLAQSSNDAAKIISGFVGDGTFIKNMNTKASSLQMADTNFADASGISDQNISTAYDISKLLQYIFYKRPFLFDISRGVVFESVGLINIGNTINISDLKNFNEFVDDPDLIGVKNGETSAARQTLATIWNIHTAQGDVPVAIIVLGSENRKADTDILLNWLKNNFSISQKSPL